MNFIQHLLKFFDRPPEPVTTGTFTNVLIDNILNVPTVRFMDKTYSGVTLQSFMKFAKFDTVSEEIYESEVNDCDDFAFEFYVNARNWAKGCPVGIVMGRDTKGKSHAWNCFVDIPKKHFYFFDPQSDVLFEPSTENVMEIII